MKQEKYTFEDLLEIMRRLRAPGGCSWDREQTHESIKKHVVEEAYELVEAIDRGAPSKIADESGDLLLQVVFHAQIGADAGAYDITDVCDAICRKMIHRHPHVFGAEEAETGGATGWDAIKRADRQQETVTAELRGVSPYLPALMRAEKIQKKAAKAGYPLPSAGTKELDELDLGAQLFALAGQCGTNGVDPELALSRYLRQFIADFERFEQQQEKEQ